MFFILSKVLDFLFSPLIWTILLFLEGFLVKNPILKKRFIYSKNNPLPLSLFYY